MSVVNVCRKIRSHLWEITQTIAISLNKINNISRYFFYVMSVNISDKGVKYSLADNMRQGKNSHWPVKKVMRRKRLTYELHDSYFRSMMITPAIPKIADVTHPNGQ